MIEIDVKGEFSAAVKDAIFIADYRVSGVRAYFRARSTTVVDFNITIQESLGNGKTHPPRCILMKRILLSVKEGKMNEFCNAYAENFSWLVGGVSRKDLQMLLKYKILKISKAKINEQKQNTQNNESEKEKIEEKSTTERVSS